MLVCMDIVFVNCLYIFGIFYLLFVCWFKLFQFYVYIVNMVWGEVIDENVLICMLEVGEIVGVGFDVFEYELVVNFKLLVNEWVMFLFYMGLVIIEGWIDMGEKVIINIKMFVDGYKLFDCVLLVMFQGCFVFNRVCLIYCVRCVFFNWCIIFFYNVGLLFLRIFVCVFNFVDVGR